MTIKEIEALSGIPRANIRYYEQEGLIAPERLTNGYRTYSEEELAALEKIKLLRGVGVSLEDIRALQKGEDELSAVLSRRLYELENEAKAVEEAKKLCKAMRGAGESYATLDAAKYMNALPEAEKPMVIAVSETNYPPCPWRRYWARWMDTVLYDMIAVAFVAFALRVDPRSTAASIVSGFFVLLCILLLEPLQLMLFKTTLGKLIFGLRVENDMGGRLSYAQGFRRGKDVVLYGMGLTIPIVELVMYWKSYRRCKAGETLNWEYESCVIPSEMRWYNGAGIAAFIAAWLLGLAFIAFGFQLPPNRGDLTVAQFAENYNYMLDIYDDYVSGERLDENGRWIEQERGSTSRGETTIYIDGKVYNDSASEPELELEYEMEDGVINAIYLHREMESNENDFVSSSVNEQVLIALAFGGARKEMGIINNNRAFIERKLREEPFEDCSFQIGGVRIERDVEYRGYYVMGDMLVHRDNMETELRESFRISLIE